MRLLLGLAGGLLAACAAGSGSSTSSSGPPDPACSVEEATPEEGALEEGALEEGASLGDGAGLYRLVLIRREGDAGTASVEGELSLVPRPAGLRRLGGYDVPLQGVARIDLREVGAHVAGSLESDDPAAPGVLVLESQGPPTTILLRFGSTANRTDPTAFDDAFTALTVRRVDEDGFHGSWRSAVRSSEARGYFCARRSG